MDKSVRCIWKTLRLFPWAWRHLGRLLWKMLALDKRATHTCTRWVCFQSHTMWHAGTVTFLLCTLFLRSGQLLVKNAMQGTSNTFEFYRFSFSKLIGQIIWTLHETDFEFFFLFWNSYVQNINIKDLWEFFDRIDQNKTLVRRLD